MRKLMDKLPLWLQVVVAGIVTMLIGVAAVMVIAALVEAKLGFVAVLFVLLLLLFYANNRQNHF